MSDVDLVVVSYNTPNAFRECFESLVEYTPGASIFVVDNASTDPRTLQYLGEIERRQFPRQNKVIVIRCPENYGYGPACNIGIRHGLSRYVAILNNDIKVSENWSGLLCEGFSFSDRVGIVGPKLVDASGRLVGTGVTNSELYTSPRGWLELDRGQYDSPEEVVYMGGACLLCNREVIESASLFDESFKFYFEEFDLSVRLRKSGWKTVYWPRCKVVHHHEGVLKESGSSSEDRNFRNQQFQRSRDLFFSRWRDEDLQLGSFVEGVARQTELTSSSDSRPTIVYFSIIPYGFRRQRPQHLARGLASRGYRVLFVDPSMSKFPVVTKRDGVDVISGVPCTEPQIYKAFEKGNIAETSQFLSTLCRDLNPVALYTGCPYWSTVLSDMELGVPLVYDRMDDYSCFDNLNKSFITECDAWLLRNSQLVVASSKVLYDSASNECQSVVRIPNGCEFEHFARAGGRGPIWDMGTIVVGYFGAISSWFDVEFVRQIAMWTERQLRVELIGAQSYIDVSSLSSLSNVQLLGEKDYSDLPRYLSGWDVCLIPFKLEPITQAVNPVKLFEYFAAGKPVISTRLPEVETFGSGLVEFADDGESACECIRRLLTCGIEEWSQKKQSRVKVAQENTWDKRVTDLAVCIERVRSGLHT